MMPYGVVRKKFADHLVLLLRLLLGEKTEEEHIVGREGVCLPASSSAYHAAWCARSSAESRF
jgi:hypothetical protein